MMAIIGMFFQDGLTGSAWGDWANYTDSPLRAFESELGVQAPVGFWDPLGLSKDGDLDKFQRRRTTELKHGRVSMIACIGYIVPEYYKWPGYCSPSAKLAFTDVPNGLAACAKLPGAGWMQMILFAGYNELIAFKETDEPGNYSKGSLGYGGKSIEDPEIRKKKLNAELANGRLAMMAIIGMFYQDGLTGSAWGDWSLYTDSPLRAFNPAREAGVSAPLGEPGISYWDPAGFCDDVDEDKFRFYRTAELKHGRVSMLALIGLIAQHSFHFKNIGGETDPAILKGVPNGIDALTTYPSSAGFGVLVLFAGLLELSSSDEGKEVGDYGDPFNFQSILAYEGEDILIWRNREINNGLMAMFGVIGTIAAEAATGLDAIGQWENSGAAFSKTIQMTTYGFTGSM